MSELIIQQNEATTKSVVDLANAFESLKGKIPAVNKVALASLLELQKITAGLDTLKVDLQKQLSNIVVGLQGLPIEIARAIADSGGMLRKAGQQIGQGLELGVKESTDKAVMTAKSETARLQKVYEAAAREAAVTGQTISAYYLSSLQGTGVKLFPGDKLRMQEYAETQKTFNAMLRSSFVEQKALRADLLKEVDKGAKEIADARARAAAKELADGKSFLLNWANQQKERISFEKALRADLLKEIEVTANSVLAARMRAASNPRAVLQVAQATASSSGNFSYLSGANTGATRDEVLAAKALVDANKALGLSHTTSASQAVKHGAALQRFGIDANDAHSAARGLASGFGALWLTWGNLGPLLAGAALSNSFVQTIKLGAQVNQTLDAMAALSELSASTMEKLNVQLLDIARNGPFGLAETAEAMKTLSLAGLKAVEVTSVLPQVLNFAIAGDTSIQKAADVLTSVGVAYGYAANSYSIVADIIAKAAAESKGSIENLGEAFKASTVLASQYGVALQDTAIGLAALANVGVVGSAGGTALRNFYVDLAGRTKQQTELLRTLGLSYEDLTVKGTKNFKSILEIVSQVNTAIEKYSSKPTDVPTQEGKAFVDRAGKAYSAIKDLLAAERKSLDDARKKLAETTGTSLKQLAATDAEAIASIYQRFSDNAGFAALAAAKVSTSALNQMKSVSSAVQAAAFETFSELENAIIGASGELKKLFNSEGFKSGLTALVTGIAEFTSFLVQNLEVIGKLTAAYLVFKAATLSGAIFAGLASSIALVTANAAALTAGLAAGTVTQITATGASALLTVTRFSGLLAVLGPLAAFMAGPWGIAIAGVVAGLSALVYFSNKANQTVEEYPFAKANAYIDSLKKQTDQINLRIEALQRGMTVEDIANDRAGKAEKLKTELAFERQILQIQTEKDRLLDRANKSSVSETSIRNSAPFRELENRRELLVRTKAALTQETQLRETETRTRAAVEKKMLEDRAATRKKAEEEELRLRLGGFKASVQIDKDSAKSRTQSEQIRADNTLAILEKMYADELQTISRASANEVSLIESRHQAGIDSTLKAGLARADAVHAGEEKQLAFIKEAGDKETAMYSERIRSIQEQFASGKVKAAEYNSEVQKAANAHIAFQQRAANDASTIKDNVFTRLAKAADAAQGEIKKLSDSYREFWEGVAREEAANASKQQFEISSLGLSDRDKAGASASYNTQAKAIEEARKQQDLLTQAQKEYNDAVSNLEVTSLNGNTEVVAQVETALTKILVMSEQLDKLKLRAAEVGGKAAVDALQLFDATQSQDFVKGVAGAITSGLYEGGQTGKKKLRDLIAAELRKPLTMYINAIVQSLVGNSGLAGAVTGLGNVGSGLANGFSNVGAFSSIASMLGNFSSGLTAGFSQFSSGVSTFASLANAAEVGGSTGLGIGLGAAGPWIAGAVALYSLVNSLTQGETRTGGQYATGVTPNGNYGAGTTFLSGPSGGQIEGDQVKSAIASTVSGINAVLKAVGSSATLTGFQAALESSGNGRGGVYAGGTLSTGAQFGELGLGGGRSNYSGTLYESTSSNSPDAQAALKNFSTDLLQATVQALQAATDIPKAISDMLKGVDAEALSVEAATTLIANVNAMAQFTAAAQKLPFTQLHDLSFEAANGIIALMGGIENFSSTLSSYYDNFYTETEKTQAVTNSITEAFKGMGLALPDLAAGSDSARAQFRSLVEAQDLTTDKGRATYTTLLQLSGSFAQITPITESATAAIEDNSAALAQQAQALKDQEIALKETIFQLENASNTEALRAHELEKIADANKPLQERIYALQDEAAALQQAADKTKALTDQRVSLEAELFKLTASSAEVRAAELAALEPANRAIQERIYALQDQTEVEQAAAAQTKQLTDQRKALEEELFKLTATTVQIRERELAALDPANQSLQQQIYALQDQKSALEASTSAIQEQANAAKAIAQERYGLETTLLNLQGDTVSLRARELDALDGSNRELQLQIYALQDQAAAATAAASAADQLAQAQTQAAQEAQRAQEASAQAAAQAAEAISQERYGLETQLLQAQGNTAALRARELLQLNPINRALQAQVWALEDQKTAAEAATAAQSDYNQALDDTAAFITGIAKTITEYLNNLDATPAGGLSPGKQLSNAQSQYQQQLTLARGGDRDALSGITGYADNLISAQKNAATSSLEIRRVIAQLKAELGALPQQANVKPEEVIVNAIQVSTGLQNAAGAEEAARLVLSAQIEADRLIAQAQVSAAQTIANASANTGYLGNVASSNTSATVSAVNASGNATVNTLIAKFDKIDANTDGLLTGPELRAALGPVATDSVLRSIFATLDTDGDQQISKLEAIRATSANLAASIALGLAPNFALLDTSVNGLLDRDELAAALGPLATNATINALIAQVDYDGDQQISKMEAIRAGVSPLADLLANTIAGKFDRLDANVDGLISTGEFFAGLAGLASNSVLQEVLNTLDTNGDGQISRLEAIQNNTSNLGNVIAQSLYASFGQIDTSINGLLDKNELVAALGPLATNAVISQVMTVLDTNNDGQISKLEAIRGSSAAIDTKSSSIIGGIGYTGDLLYLLKVIGDYTATETGALGNKASATLAETSNINANTALSLLSDRQIAEATYRATVQLLDLSSVKTNTDQIGQSNQLLLNSTNLLDSIRLSTEYIYQMYNAMLIGDGIRTVFRRIGGDNTSWFAEGGVFTSGIVTKPTMFNIGGMGESGPEAIMPLAMGSQGLGIANYGGQNNAELVAELRALRAEVQGMRYETRATAENTGKSTRLLDRFDRDGITVNNESQLLVTLPDGTIVTQ